MAHYQVSFHDVVDLNTDDATPEEVLKDVQNKIETIGLERWLQGFCSNIKKIEEEEVLWKK